VTDRWPDEGPLHERSEWPDDPAPRRRGRLIAVTVLVAIPWLVAAVAIATRAAPEAPSDAVLPASQASEPAAPTTAAAPAPPTMPVDPPMVRVGQPAGPTVGDGVAVALLVARHALGDPDLVGLWGSPRGRHRRVVAVVVESADGVRAEVTPSVAATVSVLADPSPPPRVTLPEQLVLAVKRYGR